MATTSKNDRKNNLYVMNPRVSSLLVSSKILFTLVPVQAEDCRTDRFIPIPTAEFSLVPL